MSGLQGPHWRRDCPQKCSFQGSNSQDNQEWRCLGIPTQAPVLITPEEPCVLKPGWGEAIHQFPFSYWGKFLCAYWSPPLSSQSAFIVGLSGWAKRFYFSCSLSCNWDTVLFFTLVSDRARVSLTPFVEGYTEQDPCLCFLDYGALPFSHFNWTKCKS